MENMKPKFDLKPTYLFNKKNKMISSISNTVFIIHSIIILIVLIIVFKEF
jgi:hypothetical protein